MADSDQSSENVSVDYREESSQDTRLVFTEDEECLIIRMFNLIGERWSLIAGRIPGRTAEEIEKYWTSSCREINRCGQTAIRPTVTRISTPPSALHHLPQL